MFRPLTAGLLTLPLLFCPIQAQYDSPGSFTMNASVPSSSTSGASSCIVLAQLTASPPAIQAMHPICPPGTSTGQGSYTVDWPIASTPAFGDGFSSQLLIYGQVGADGRAGCVMSLTEGQQQYLVVNKKVVEWNNDLQELWDVEAKSFVMEGTTGGALTCTPSKTYLPSFLVLPDPYSLPAIDPIWQTPISLSTPEIATSSRISQSASYSSQSSATAATLAYIATTAKSSAIGTVSTSSSYSSQSSSGTGLAGVQTFTYTAPGGPSSSA